MLSLGRGLIVVLTLFLLWLSRAEELFSVIWLTIPAVVFGSLVLLHHQVAKQLKRARKLVEYYEQRIKQLDGQTPDHASNGTRYIDASHPYSSDLDLFGKGSLFELICAARTRLGENTLANWLCAGTDSESIMQRQLAIEELRNRLDFREQLALVESKLQDEFDLKQLLQWASAAAHLVAPWKRALSIILWVLFILLIPLSMAGLGSWPLLLIGLIQIAFYVSIFKQIKQTSSEVDACSSGLEAISKVLYLIEQQQFNSPLLQAIQADIQTQGRPPSWQIQRLRNLIQKLNNSLRNQYIAPVAFFFGAPLHAAHAIECWRRKVGPNMAQWFAVVGQLEALNSLARYAFENPDFPYAQLLADDDAARFDAVDLGHPLIAEKSRINNSISINSEHSLIMVSGSNMSGKSTLLRSIGINLVLALCGAPVTAKSLKTSRFVIGSVMRVNDSLQQGASHFYAVISRLKSVVELAGKSPPLLFLLDEILQGTNSYDRRVGAQGVIAELISQNAMGLVTTHDLELTKIADSLDNRAINIHFEDHLIDGEIHFDYKIRQGVIQKSNALELMRMIGLKLPSDESR